MPRGTAASPRCTQARSATPCARRDASAWTRSCSPCTPAAGPSCRRSPASCASSPRSRRWRSCPGTTAKPPTHCSSWVRPACARRWTAPSPPAGAACATWWAIRPPPSPPGSSRASCPRWAATRAATCTSSSRPWPGSPRCCPPCAASRGTCGCVRARSCRASTGRRFPPPRRISPGCGCCTQPTCSAIRGCPWPTSRTGSTTPRPRASGTQRRSRFPGGVISPPRRASRGVPACPAPGSAPRTGRCSRAAARRVGRAAATWP